MKKLIVITAVLVAALAALAGCSTAQQATAQQVLAKLQTDVQGGCQVFQATEPSVAIFIAADPTANAVITGVNLACTANAAINVASVNTLVSTGIPAAITAVNNSTVIPAAQKPVIIGALTALNVALSTALVVYNQNQAAVVPTAPTAPAAAPAVS
jgi:hypothetical protein